MQNKGILQRSRTYRNLWMAKVGSQFGDWFNQVALAQITLMLTHSSAAMGFVLLSFSVHLRVHSWIVFQKNHSCS